MNLIEDILLILRPLLAGLQQALRLFMRTDMRIYDIPYYVWISGGLFFVFIVSLILERVDE